MSLELELEWPHWASILRAALKVASAITNAFYRQGMESLTVPSCSQLGKERKEIQTEVCLTPSVMSATELPPLSSTEPQHSEEAPTVTNTQNHWLGQKGAGHTEDENTHQSNEPHGRQEAGRKGSTAQGGAGERMGK